MYKPVKELLKKLNYIIQVTGGEDICIVDYPRQRFTGRDEASMIITYALIRKGQKPGIECHHLTGLDETEEFLPMPEFALRTFIISQIYKNCALMSYHVGLIDYVDFYGKSYQDLDMIERPKDKEEQQKEMQFLNLFGAAVSQTFAKSFDEQAEELGMSKEYSLIKQSFVEIIE